MGPQGGYYQRQQPGGYQPAGRPGPYQQQGPPMSEHEIWVASGCPVQGPGGWTQYQTPEGERYFHHRDRNETQWEPPAGWQAPGPH
ncbi:hypothetical protein QBZ16_003322 [Prototheca wickerhamii]|uniref:WW domain-containing protein n=1 Tax=Prototheca wickerhamii TaxID=3111 RepID=A0AAD9MII7_PROWI|nr:hypothetical protein QBZ16_003322 [Prototheca wickerhamii]